ncbi:hypothetical protein Fcan01_22568 [Folsomia candida]|uniref:Uncharacterized protein n=1 Tax=Folsomia candida TaxID=158441 RepID=A0A226DD34_FOLCA|nr:hypothetical protein Fcan01_22568 [Folsomia candida]
MKGRNWQRSTGPEMKMLQNQMRSPSTAEPPTTSGPIPNPFQGERSQAATSPQGACEGSSSRYCCRGLFEQWLLVASQVEGNNGSTNKEEARVKAEVPCTYNVACWSGHAENSAASCVPCQEESDAKALDLPKVIKREGKIVIKPRNGTLNTFPSHNKRAAGILHTFCIINSSPQWALNEILPSAQVSKTAIHPISLTPTLPPCPERWRMPICTEPTQPPASYVDDEHCTQFGPFSPTFFSPFFLQPSSFLCSDPSPITRIAPPPPPPPPILIPHMAWG